jgi:hypothetical protein
VSIRDLERRLTEAERQADVAGISDRLRERRLDEVAALQRELDAAYAAADGEPAGHGRRSLIRW